MLVQLAVLIHLYPEMKLGRQLYTVSQRCVDITRWTLPSAVDGHFSSIQCFAVAHSSANVLVPVP